MCLSVHVDKRDWKEEGDQAGWKAKGDGWRRLVGEVGKWQNMGEQSPGRAVEGGRLGTEQAAWEPPAFCKRPAPPKNAHSRDRPGEPPTGPPTHTRHQGKEKLNNNNNNLGAIYLEDEPCSASAGHSLTTSYQLWSTRLGQGGGVSCSAQLPGNRKGGIYGAPGRRHYRERAKRLLGCLTGGSEFRK